MKKIGKNKLIFVLVLILIVPTLLVSAYFVQSVQGDTYTSYYSGDSIFYYNKTVIVSVNSGLAEIFEFENGSLNKVSEISSLEGEDDFTDLELIKEDARLYLYLINGRYLYKYDVTRTNKPALVDKIKDNSWDWFLGLEELDNRLISLGRNNIKFWNENMQVIEAIPKVENEYSYNVGFDKSKGYIFSLKEDKVFVYDRYSGDLVAEREMEFNNNHFRKSYFDKNLGLYVVDDNSVVRYLIDEGLNKLVKQTSFKHISENGYDAVGTDNSNYIYFSDGVGVVKLNKYSLKPVDWIFTTSVGGKKGWAQGMNIVKDNTGKEVIVVYNLNNILVLDSNMDVVDYYNSEKNSQKIKQKLYLNLNKNVVEAGETIRLSGGGFGSNETLDIKYLGEKEKVSTDNEGYFYKELEIPSVLPVHTSVKVDGESSRINYSVSLIVE